MLKMFKFLIQVYFPGQKLLNLAQHSAHSAETDFNFLHENKGREMLTSYQTLLINNNELTDSN